MINLAIQLVLLGIISTANFQAPQIAPSDAPAKVAVVSQAEPGEKLLVSGTVFGSDGKPLNGASIYVYQTDATGLYTPVNNDNRNPRLRGYMRTGPDGRYEFSTIKPAPYPTNRTPAHIHYIVNVTGYQERVFEILFEDDPLVDAQTRSRAVVDDSPFSIRPLRRDGNGKLTCTQDVKMKK